VFQPFQNGKPFGKWEVFADGFSGSARQTASGRAAHRPCGLAQGPDGSLYVSDDTKGTIYKISFKNKKAAVKASSSKATHAASANAGKGNHAKKSGATIVKGTMVSRSSMNSGKKLYTQYCLSCHQADGGGVQNMNPPLIKTAYVNGEKSKLIAIILKGLSGEEIEGQTYTNVMAPYDFLNDREIADLLTFIRNSFKNKAGAVSPAEVKAVREKI
jgi:mono/diheme cytochrome c family protein